MRRLLEYGDNFPVVCQSWNPTVPWRFPHHEIRPRGPLSLLRLLVPWVMLGLGVALGMLLMSLKMPGAVVEREASPSVGPEQRSQGQAISPILKAPPLAPAEKGRKAPAPKLKSEWA